MLLIMLTGILVPWSSLNRLAGAASCACMRQASTRLRRGSGQQAQFHGRVLLIEIVARHKGERVVASYNSANYAPNLCFGSARFGYALLPANVRPEAALRPRRSPAIETPERAADFARWQMGRFHGANSGRSGQLQAQTDLAYPARWRRIAPPHITVEGNNERPRWTPDGKKIIFISTRSGGSQVWSMDREGNNAEQITRMSTEATGVLVSPDGKKIVFLSSVYPDCADDACNKARMEAEASSKLKARVYTSLLYRHWNEWQGKRRSHLFSSPIEGGPAKDLTPGQL